MKRIHGLSEREMELAKLLMDIQQMLSKVTTEG